jgi:signal transduction histidine kinase
VTNTPVDPDTSLAPPASEVFGRPEQAAEWVTVADGQVKPAVANRPVRTRRIFAQVIVATALVMVVVAVGGSWASLRIAEQESVTVAAQTTDLLAESVVQPAVEDALATGSPAAFAKLDAVIRSHVLTRGVVRVKVWTEAGTIVYSDEQRIVGATFVLGEDDREVLENPTTVAEVSDLTRPENAYERGYGKLLEVYRPIWTPNGTPLLLETYSLYDDVATRAGNLWRGFAGITVSCLLLLIVFLLPILWRLLDRLNAAQDQRVSLLEHAVNASDDERRRIAATLHDGVVQELAAASFAAAGEAERASTAGHPELATRLRGLAETVRGTIGGLRSLLVDIYPPSLKRAGLAAALTDLAGTVRTRDIEVALDLPADDTGLDEAGDRLVYRVAQEALRNVARHAAATRVELAIVTATDDVTLTIRDDGVGFDPAEALLHPAEGHYGVQVMTDLALQAGATLDVSSAPGNGTCWRLRVPRP